MRNNGIAAALAVVLLLFTFCGGIYYKSYRQDHAREWTSKVDVSYRWETYDPQDTIRHEILDYRFNTNAKVDSIQVRIYWWEGDTQKGDYYYTGEIAGLDSGNKKVWSKPIRELMFRAPGMRPGEVVIASSSKRVK